MTETFRPPWILRNPHVQTILGHFLPGPRFCYPTQQRHLLLDDGDALVLHDAIPSGWKPGDMIAVMTHGLGGCHDSGHQRRLARAFAQRQIRSVRFDQRGCGAGLPFARKLYHGGRSPDALAVIQEVHRWSPESPLVLIGVSLGGNIVLKMAGEQGEALLPNLNKLVAISPPVDMHVCSALIGEKRNRLYDRHFAKQLTRFYLQRREHFPELPHFKFPRKMSIRLFDEMITAPLNGFRDADDYYSQVGAAPLLGSIAVPTLILTSRDDPFITPEPFEAAALPGHVEAQIVDYGGHLGFLGGDGNGGMRWAERRIIDWVLS